MDTFGHDLRYAVRMLMKSPVVTAAALVSLALGLGANTAIFSLLNVIFLRAMPVEDPQSVVAVYTTEDSPTVLGRMMLAVSRPNYQDLRDKTEVFTGIADIIFAGANMSFEGGEAEPVGGQLVTSGYFEVLGVSAQAGRVFVDEGNDEVPGSEPFLVLSHRFWSQDLGGDPEVVGRELRMNGEVFTVVGVAPEGFRGTRTFGNPDFWAPMSMHRTFLEGAIAGYYDDRRALITNAVARLAPGVTLEQANGAVDALGQQIAEAFPDDFKNRSFALERLPQAALAPPNQREGLYRAGALLGIVVGVVLLIACANVANLLLGRAASRRREIGVRLALGASRGRLVRQLLAESLVLAFLAGGLGLLVAIWARNALWALRPPFLQNAAFDLSFDPRVLGFAALLTVVTGILFGLVPALQASRPELVDDLTRSSDSSSGAGRLFSFRNALVMAQVALSLVALVGAGLFLRSLGAATAVDVGFQPDQLAMAGVNLARAGYDEDRGRQAWEGLTEAAAAVPGVESATVTTLVPLGGGGFMRTVIVEGRDESAENNRVLTPVGTVGDNYFKTVGMELLRGRDLSSADRADGQAVVVITEAMAEFFWPGEDALGKRFNFIGQDVVREVVGVVADTKWVTVGEDPQPIVFVPWRQSYEPTMSVVVRVPGGSHPEAFLEPLRRAIGEVDGNLAALNPTTGPSIVQQGLWAARMGASMLAILGALALVLAAIGIYGVMSYSVGQRDREISVRMAMGADRPAVLSLVLRQGMKVVGTGLAVGLALAVLGGRAISSLLYDIAPTDAAALGGTLAVLVVVSLLACLVPALRATSVDPVRALRFER